MSCDGDHLNFPVKQIKYVNLSGEVHGIFIFFMGVLLVFCCLHFCPICLLSVLCV